MRFNRLLMAGLMALWCAGTAAAARLNAVHVTPTANAATVTLQTTGSFAHKEYRPDEHLLLIDLTGVTTNPSLAHSTVLKSAVLEKYAVSSYTNAAGTTVTRLELSLGEKVTASVADAHDGLKILLSAGSGTAAVAKSAKAATAEAKPSAAQTATAAAREVDKHMVAKASAPEHPAARSRRSPAAEEKAPAEVARTIIRSVSVEHAQGALDVIIEGPSSATPYRLKHPDRLVLDFHNAVLRPSVKNVAVHTKDVLRVRVGRPQPETTRVVIDLGGPRTFEVVPSADRVVVRVKTEAAAPLSAAAPASASPLKAVAMPVAPSAPAVHVRTAHLARARQSETTAAAPSSAPAVKPAVMPVSDPSPMPKEAAPAPAAPQKPAVEEAHLVAPVTDKIPASIASDPEPGSPASAHPQYTGEPISVNLKDVDLKDFFRLIHEISGLNVVLDPSVHGTVTLVLDDVPWDQALDIVLKNNNLDRELEGNVLRIASADTLRREAVERRAQAEAVAQAVNLQTIVRTLSYAQAATVVPTVKKFLTARGDVIADARTNSLIISDIPSVLPSLDHLITQLDKKTQEVEIEVRVVSATRSFSRDLGFQLGFMWGNGVSSVAGLPSNVGETTLVDRTGNTIAKVPLFSNFPAPGATTGLGFASVTSSYALDAALTAAEQHNLAKVLSRPRVVTQSNVKAEVKQGVQIPVYTQGTANANSSVTYVNALLRLSVTPRITADNTIFLSVDVENTQPDGLAAGNSNYILSTQQATTQVLVTNGSTVMIGGVIQTQNTVATSQTPLLGDIPWLGNLFKERHVATETDELIFFITPRIVQT